jgi:predicted MPP superfamily phosphohydrolase
VGKTLVQLSDIHVHPMVPDAYVLETFNRVRALEPDFVVYTGDFTTVHDGMYPHAEFIYSQAPQGLRGTFASLGNHDYGRNWAHPEAAQTISTLLTQQGVRVLTNAMDEVGGLHVIGLGDVWGRDFFPHLAFANIAPGVPAIALSHNPDTVDLEGWTPFEGWILAGHTHGGQCKPPFLPPPVLPVRNRQYTSGEFALSHGRTMYISRGVGSVMPVRFNVRPEVTLFTLRRA